MRSGEYRSPLGSERTIAVLDSSVGVKWVKPEAGSDEALSLLQRHRDGEIQLVVPAFFMHEVTAVAVRHGGADLGARTWSALQDAMLTVVRLDDTLAAAAFDQVERLGCTFYDALAPALAGLLGGTLYSADQRAHSGVSDAVLLG